MGQKDEPVAYGPGVSCNIRARDPPSAKCQNRFRVFAGFHQFPSFLKLGNPETTKPIAKLWFNQCFSCMT